MATTPEDSRKRVGPHPVAKLLTDEQKARVRAARFYRNDDPERDMCATVVADIDGKPCCPMGVVLGGDERFPISDQVAEALGKPRNRQVVRIIDEFIQLVDMDGITDPADVYALLGCEPQDGAS